MSRKTILSILLNVTFVLTIFAVRYYFVKQEYDFLKNGLPITVGPKWKMLPKLEFEKDSIQPGEVLENEETYGFVSKAGIDTSKQTKTDTSGPMEEKPSSSQISKVRRRN